MCRLACLTSRGGSLRRPAADLHGILLQAADEPLDLGRRGSMDWLCGMDPRLRQPYLSDLTSPTSLASYGASSRPTPSSPSPRPTASPSGSIVPHSEGTRDHHMVASTVQHRGAAGCRPRLRRTLQCPVDRRKKRLPEPRSSSSGVAPAAISDRASARCCVRTNLCPRQKPGALHLAFYKAVRLATPAPVADIRVVVRRLSGLA